MKPVSTLLLFFLFSQSFSFSGYAQTKFEKTYGTASKSEYGRDAVVISNGGGYAVTGWANKGANNKDIYFLKLDTCGRTKISRTYGGSEDDMAYSISELNGGNFAMAGETKSYGSGQNDGYLTKVSGVTFGSAVGRAIGDTSIDIAQDFKQLSGGAYVVTGYTQQSASKYDIFIAKFNSSLGGQWIYRLGGNNDDQAFAIQQLSSGDFIIAGATKSYGIGNWDVYLIKTNANGIVTWAKTYGTVQSDIAYNVKQTLDGGFIVVGKTRNSSGASLDDILLLKVSSAGTLQWVKSYGGSQDETGEDVVQLSDTSYVVVGYTKTFGSGDWDVYLFKVDKNGSTIWARTCGGADEDKAFSIKKANDNGFLLTGHSNSFGPGVFDAYVMKTNSLGFTGCNDSSGINTYTPHDTVLNGYVQDTFLFVVNGAAVDTLNTIDSINCSTCNPPKSYLDNVIDRAEFTIYPNPAANYVIIDAQFESNDAVELLVYNSLGILIYKGKIEPQVSINSYQLNTSNWVSGLYMIRISGANKTLTKNIVISR